MLYFYNYFSLKTITCSFTTLNKLHFSHFFTIFCVIFSCFSSDFLQNLISSIGILTFGILHGANDLKILAKKKSFFKKLNSPTFMARIYRNCFFRAIYFLFYTSNSFINLCTSKLLSLWRATL